MAIACGAPVADGREPERSRAVDAGMKATSGARWSEDRAHVVRARRRLPELWDYGSGMLHVGTDWRVVDRVAAAWFESSSLVHGADFARRIVESSTDTLVDVRASGVRVRVGSDEHTKLVSEAARELGLVANPAVLQQLSVVVETPDAASVSRFWQVVLGYEQDDRGDLHDPLRRDPTLWFRSSDDQRPHRNRLHLDVVRPAAAVELARPAEPFGPYGVCHADSDGNEVDLVPGDPLGETDATADWQAVFSAIVAYRTTSSAQQCDLVTEVASLADAVGLPMLIDLRPGLVIIDTGKDCWDVDAHGLELDFTVLAADIQRCARELGATPEPGLARFVQLFFDAADVAAIRAFWVAALGYTLDRRDHLTDIHDPRRLNPVFVFQPLDESDVERRRQRNRIVVELAVPADQARLRLADMIATGGRVLHESEGRWRVADPEGNEIVIACPD